MPIEQPAKRFSIAGQRPANVVDVGWFRLRHAHILVAIAAVLSKGFLEILSGRGFLSHLAKPADAVQNDRPGLPYMYRRAFPTTAGSTGQAPGPSGRAECAMQHLPARGHEAFAGRDFGPAFEVIFLKVHDIAHIARSWQLVDFGVYVISRFISVVVAARTSTSAGSGSSCRATIVQRLEITGAGRFYMEAAVRGAGQDWI